MAGARLRQLSLFKIAPGNFVELAPSQVLISPVSAMN